MFFGRSLKLYNVLFLCFNYYVWEKKISWDVWDELTARLCFCRQMFTFRMQPSSCSQSQDRDITWSLQSPLFAYGSAGKNGSTRLDFYVTSCKKKKYIKKKNIQTKNIIIIVCGTWKYFVMCQVISPSLVNVVVNKMKKCLSIYFICYFIDCSFVSTPCVFLLYLFWLNEIFSVLKS